MAGASAPNEELEESEIQNKNAPEARVNAHHSVPYLSLFKYADGWDYVYIFLGTIGAIVDGLLLPGVVFIMVHLVNGFVTIHSDPEGEKRTANKYIKIMAYLAPVYAALSFLEPSCWTRAGERQVLRIRSKYLKAILRQNEGFFDTQGASSSEVVNSISADTGAIQEAISEKVGTFVSCLANFCGGLTVALYFSWRLGLIWIAMIPVFIIPGIIYGKKLGETAGAMHFASLRAGSVAEQALSSINTVYSFVGENQLLTKYSRSLIEIVKLGARGGLYKSLAIGSGGLVYSAWALVLWVGSRLVIHDGLKGAYVLNAGFAAVNGILGIAMGLGLVKFFADGCKAAHRIFEVIDRVPEIDSWDTQGKTLDSLEGTLELRNLRFAYPARPNAIIFNNFSLTIPAGKKIALVGDSGSGKSTVIALLERFYDPIEGQVLVDGVDIKELQLRWLRTRIGLVSQEPALFATSIKENILLGKDNSTLQEVIEAAKQSNAHNFIEQFPEGYETQVGERGVKMSGGQKQRIAIARAILKNPPILLLDEATSALDAESEKLVQQALDSVSTGRTTVVVAHRLSTIQDADIIVVMKDGQVVEQGTHDELSRISGGAYADLMHLQHTRAPNSQVLKPMDRDVSSRRISYSRSLSARLSSSRIRSFRDSGGHPNSISSVDIEDMPVSTTLKKPSPPSFRRLLALNRPEWRQATLGSVGAIFYGCLHPLYSFLLSGLITTLYKTDYHTLTVEVRKYCFGFLAMSVAAMFLSFLQHYNFAIMGEMLTKRLRERLLSKILTFEVGWFDADENSSGVISARLATETTVARSLVGDRISLLLQTGSAIVFASVAGFVLSWKLAVVMIGVQPIVVVGFLVKGQVLKRMYASSVKAQEDSSQVASEAVSHHRTIAAFSAEGKVVNLFDSMQVNPKKVRGSQRRAVVAGLGLGVSNGLLVSTWAFSLWWAQRLLVKGELSVSTLFRVFFIIIATGRVIGETGSVATDIARSANSIITLFTILDRKTLINPDDETAKKVEKLEGNIELRKVEFAYPTRPNVMVFKDLSLKVKAGRNVALVGRSGSGKSTVVCLTLRFYDPIKGSVILDGVDIRQLHLKTLRLHIALVSQEPTLFFGTIRENIQYGRETATEAEIVEAAKAANAFNFISSLKDGFNTNTGDRGLQLSGGQKQRIAIARAILKNPSVLLLDEATSALDAQSERVVQEALDTVMVGRTTIVVAHRLSTIQNCDSIAVIQDGSVCEQGRHDELLAKGEGGAYSALVRLQNKAADV